MKYKTSLLEALFFLSNLASETLASRDALAHLIKQASIKVAKQRSRLKETSKDLRLMIHLLRSYSSGYYSRISTKNLILVAGVCLYFLNPLDMVPDFLALGLLDDIQLVALVVNLLKNDLQRFKDFVDNPETSSSL